MKLNKSEKTGATTFEMEILIEAPQFKEAISKVFRKESKKYNVQGFRKGHAPRNLIEKMYGQDVFHYDAVNDVFPSAYEEAIKETKIEPVSRPDVELISATEADGAVVKVTVTTKPEMKVNKYTGLEAIKYITKAEDAQVDSEINGMCERNSRIITREGAAKDGDIATIDYDGFVDDVAFAGGKAEKQDLTLGSDQFIPGFEEQVVGHSAGDSFDVKVTFPTEYHAEDLAGKDAVFKVVLHEVKYKELPEIDDEFAKDVSEFDTIKELKDDIRAKLQENLDKQADLEAENMLVEQVVASMEGDIPEVMYEGRVDELVQDFAFRLQQQGLNLDTYLQYSGMDEKAFRDGFKEQAEKQVKMRLALETIVKIEKIEANEKDIDDEVSRIAEQYKMEKEKVREVMPVTEIAKDLAVNKAIDLIKEKATIKEEVKKDEPEKKEDEKPAAKKASKKAAVKKKDKAAE